MSLKYYKIFFYCFAVCILGGLVFAYYHHRTSIPQNNIQSISRHRNSHNPRFEIKGFHYDAHYKGKRAISIKADRFSIQKKKVGFFRFGLLNEARLENASIRIYGRSKLSESNPDESRNKANPRQALTFDNVLSRQTLPSLPIRRISSIVMEPVYVEIHDEQSAVTQISASSAAIRLKKRDIVFKGDVKVVSGSRILTTERLRMLPEDFAIRADRHFVLNTAKMQLEGDQITTDIFLRPVTP